MLRLIRRMLDSKVGVWVALAFVVFVGLAFAAADLSGQMASFGTSVGGGNGALTVGDRKVDEAEMRQRVQDGYRAASARQPELDLASFVRGGGFEATVDRVLNAVGLEQFALRNGLAAGKRLVDGEIASTPSFQGAGGRFDETAFRRLLAENGLTETDLRDDIRNGLLTRQLLAPVATDAFVPPSIARRYAQLSLESRAGSLATIPASAMAAGAPPSAAEVTAFYRRNLARYTVPERRVLRLARFGKDTVAAKAVPNDAQVAEYFRANADRFGASERRDITQVTFFDRAAAEGFAQTVRGGQAIVAAAKTAGLQPLVIRDQDRAAYARSAGEAAAAAVFGAAEGTLLPPVRSQGGFIVARVDGVTRRPAQTLAQARDTIVQELTAERSASLLSELDARIYERVSDGDPLPDIARAEGLTLDTTPPVTAAGANPDAPAAAPVLPPAIAQRLAQMSADDDPIVDTLVPDEQFFIADVERVVPAAPRPLDTIRARVAADLVADRQLAAARAVADAIIARVNRGQTLSQAVAAAGVRLPAVQPIRASRQELEAAQQQVPPPIALMFAMAPGTAKRVAAPAAAGYGVVALTTVTPGDAAKARTLATQRRRQLSSELGDEYGRQFALAARKAVGETRDEATLAKLRGELAGGAAAPQ